MGIAQISRLASRESILHKVSCGEFNPLWANIDGGCLCFFLVALLTSSFRGMFDGFQIKMCDRFDRWFHVKRTNLQPKSRLGMSWHGEIALRIPYSTHVSACLGWICWEVTEASRPKMARQLHAEDAAFWRTCKVGCWLTVIVRGEVHTINRKDMGSLSYLSQCLLACDFWSLAAGWHKNYCKPLCGQRIGWDGIENWKQDVLWQWMCFRCSPLFPVYFPNGVLELQHCQWISKARNLTSRTNRTFSCISEKHMSNCIYSGRRNV